MEFRSKSDNGGFGFDDNLIEVQAVVTAESLTIRMCQLFIMVLENLYWIQSSHVHPY